jgi:hypothetical protein
MSNVTKSVALFTIKYGRREKHQSGERMPIPDFLHGCSSQGSKAAIANA